MLRAAKAKAFVCAPQSVCSSHCVCLPRRLPFSPSPPPPPPPFAFPCVPQLGARKYDDAGAACQELMRANSSDTKLLVLRARVLAAQGNSGSAIKHLSEALRVDPDCAPAARLLKLLRKADTLKTAGNDAFKGGRWQAAVDAYAECLALDPTDENSAFASKLYCNRAAAWLKLGQHEQALADATRSVELDDKYVKGYQRRAAAAQALGDKESVEAALRDLHKASDLAETAGDHATVEELRGSIRDAKAALKKARRKDYYKVRVCVCVCVWVGAGWVGEGEGGGGPICTRQVAGTHACAGH